MQANDENTRHYSDEASDKHDDPCLPIGDIQSGNVLEPSLPVPLLYCLNCVGEFHDRVNVRFRCVDRRRRK